MAGILDSKSRIIDAILTSEGRRQLAEGTFTVSYATFTDAGVAYVPDADAGHEDPTEKFYFEACNLPQDQVTFEANDEGKLVPFRAQEMRISTSGGNISSSVSDGFLENGRLVAKQRHFGRRVKVDFIYENSSDLGKGFTYTDSTGLSGSILVDPSIPGGQFKATAPSGGSPFVAYVGTMGNVGPAQFAQAISGAIGRLSILGGPSVTSNVSNCSVFIDSLKTQVCTGLKIFATGTLSSPLYIEEAALGGRIVVDELENASFATQIQGILTSSFDNFAELSTLSSIDKLFLDDKFEVKTDDSSGEVTFDLTNMSKTTMSVMKNFTPSLNSIDSIFNDDKLSHLENFAYLPPIVKVSDTVLPDKTKLENLTPYLLGNYPSWGDNEKKLTYDRLSNQLTDFKNMKSTVRFKKDKTSRNNRLLGQFFEVSEKHVSKLDVVDFGEITSENSMLTQDKKKVFFVGKTFLDNRGTVCFVNMFTLLFSHDDEDE